MTTLEKYGNLKVPCPNEDIGCTWKGFLKELDGHSGPCEKKLFREAIINIQMLNGRLEQKDREIHFLKNDFAVKLEKISKDRIVKKKQKLEKIRTQTENLCEKIISQMEEVKDENVKQKEEIETLKTKVDELNKTKEDENQELRSELAELKKQNQKLDAKREVNKDLAKREELSIINNELAGPSSSSVISTPTHPSELVGQLSLKPTLPSEAKQVFFSFSIDGDNIGRVIIDLYRDKAPNTCTKFAQLCSHDQGVGYKGSKVEYLDNYWCKMGDEKQLKDASGGNVLLPTHLELPEENRCRTFDKGFVSMNVFGSVTKSYFRFILRSVLGKYDVVIGKVTDETWSVVEKIAKVPTKSNKPAKTICIDDCGVLV